MHLQVQQDLIWVWPESGPDAAEESLGKSPTLGTLMSETNPGEGRPEMVHLETALALYNAVHCQHCLESFVYQNSSGPAAHLGTMQACAGHYSHEAPAVESTLFC